MKAIAYFVVPALAALDLAENFQLWRASAQGKVTSLSWGSSHDVLVVGLGLALGASVIITLATDPRLYWTRHGGTLSRRRMSPRWRRRLGLSDGPQAASPRRLWLRALVWSLGSGDVARWKGVGARGQRLVHL